jgi:hypothetical protein
MLDESSIADVDNWQRVHDLLRGKVEKRGECWEWTGYRMPSGHGQLRRSRSGGILLAHRYVWRELVGEIPDCVLHRCDNPPCVRPSHLWLGTQADNIADMWAKGRGSNPPAQWDGIHCKKGHVIANNPYFDKHGGRRCKTCMNEKSRKWWIDHPELLNLGRKLRAEAKKESH